MRKLLQWGQRGHENTFAVESTSHEKTFAVESMAHEKNFGAELESQAENFDGSESLKVEIGTGNVICMANDLLPIDEKNWYVPAWLI